MGYVSEMYADDFKSPFSVEELNERADKLQVQHPEFFYEFEEVVGGGVFIKAEGWCKHYAHYQLARFLSDVMSVGFARLCFVGENGDKWGWLCLPGEVHEISYEPSIGEVPLHQYLKQRGLNQ